MSRKLKAFLYRGLVDWYVKYPPIIILAVLVILYQVYLDEQPVTRLGWFIFGVTMILLLVGAWSVSTTGKSSADLEDENKSGR